MKKIDISHKNIFIVFPSLFLFTTIIHYLLHYNPLEDNYITILMLIGSYVIFLFNQMVDFLSLKKYDRKYHVIFNLLLVISVFIIIFKFSNKQYTPLDWYTIFFSFVMIGVIFFTDYFIVKKKNSEKNTIIIFSLRIISCMIFVLLNIVALFHVYAKTSNIAVYRFEKESSFMLIETL